MPGSAPAFRSATPKSSTRSLLWTATTPLPASSIHYLPSMVPRPPPPVASSSTSTAHSLAILTEYTHTLDSLPLDLSRNFADLRELDAVLSSSMHILTSKINQLTTMIENKTASKEERLWLLAEIAEEAGRLKPGADDKIRVACHSADVLAGHKTHMTTLLEHMPDQQFGKLAGMLGRKTMYPHVATRSYMPAGMTGEGGRRQRRNAYGSLLARDANDLTPAVKRKRVAKDDDSEVVTRSPRKDKTADPTRPRGGPRARKCVFLFPTLVNPVCAHRRSRNLQTRPCGLTGAFRALRRLPHPPVCHQPKPSNEQSPSCRCETSQYS